MELEQSSLYREINKIITSGSKPVHFSWTMEILANGEKIKPLKILSIDLIADYENNYAEELIVRVAIGPGTYAKKIYPYKENLQITLFRKPLNEVTDITNPDQKYSAEVYRGTLIDAGNPIIENNTFNTPTETSLNLNGIFEIDFQLVNKTLEQLRFISVGQIFRNATVTDVITGMLGYYSECVRVDGARKIKGVNMIPANNKVVRNQIIIPQGTPLVDVPIYVQKSCGGVYSGGMGYYQQGDYWYVWPSYSVTRTTEDTKVLTVLNVPKHKLPGIERTYREEGNSVVVIANGNVKYQDDSEVDQLNFGNGIRFVNADKVLNSFGQTKNNKTIFNRNINNSEVSSNTRTTKLNNVKVSDNPISANPYFEYSKLAKRLGNVISLVWQNSLPSLVTPGMPVKILYQDTNEIKTLYGVVLKAHHYIQTKGYGLTDTRYICSTSLTVFVKEPEN